MSTESLFGLKLEQRNWWGLISSLRNPILPSRFFYYFVYLSGIREREKRGNRLITFPLVYSSRVVSTDKLPDSGPSSLFLHFLPLFFYFSERWSHCKIVTKSSHPRTYPGTLHCWLCLHSSQTCNDLPMLRCFPYHVF